MSRQMVTIAARPSVSIDPETGIRIVTGGTGGGGGSTVAMTGTDYTTMRIRNIKLMTSIPQVADFSGPGDIIGVYLP